MAAKLSLSELVLMHRKAAGLSRRELAMFSGVGQTAIYEIEHGKESVRLDTLLRLFQTLNIELKYESPLLSELGHA